MLQSQTNKKDVYPEEFTEDDKLTFDLLLEQSKMLFPNLVADEWLLRMGITAYMKKAKNGTENIEVSDEEIAEIKKKHDKEVVYYTPIIEKPLTDAPPNIITVE